MALELNRDTIKFDQVIGVGKSQMLVDRDIIISDIKPDMMSILSIEGKANISRSQVEMDRVVVDGAVNFSILYSTNGESQPVYSMSHSEEFSHYIDISGVMPNMDPEVKCNIEHIDFNKINGRKLNIKCVLNINGKVNDRVPVETVREISGIEDVQVLNDTVLIDDIVEDNSIQNVVRGSIIIPESMPAADEILKYDALVHRKDISIEDGKVVISGCVLVPILYLSKGDKADIYRMSEDILFTHTMEMPGVTQDMTCSIDYNVDEIYAELKENENEDKRLIEVEVVLGIKTRVFNRVEFPVIVDLYAPSIKIESERKDIDMDLFFGTNSSPAVVKETIQLPKDLPEIEKVYDIICKPAVLDCKTVDDKVTVEGVVGCDIIYLARGEVKQVCSFSDEVPFKSSISFPGCKPNMYPEVYVDIESMDCSTMTKNEVEVKINIDCMVKIFEKISKSFILNAEEIKGEVPSHKASITIYMVQPKDTLWKIAKRYSTTIENIVEVNELTDPDNILAGTKLIIFKKYK